MFGHFYSVVFWSKTIIQCRSVLEITSRGRMREDLAELSSSPPDAIIVMMNPGSSSPAVEVDNRISPGEIQHLPISLVPAKPDATQYQIMRVMHYREWQQVRVLNLSDLRSPKSSEFVEMFRKLEEEDGYDGHSIFSTVRRCELSEKLPEDFRRPVILAWGLDGRLSSLTQRCRGSLNEGHNICGLREAGAGDRFRHPLPRSQMDKNRWVSRIVEELSGSERFGGRHEPALAREETAHRWNDHRRSSKDTPPSSSS